jgi:hypothetical protein
MVTNLNQINLLWSGGWDSTYRLLYLLVVKHSVVQPYYVIDHRRSSVPNELSAMEKIRHLFIETYPEKKRLLLPTIVTEKKHIRQNKDITHKFYGVANASRISLGPQVEWLALFADEKGLFDLEVCHEKKPSPSAFDKLILPEIQGKGHECRLKNHLSNKDLSIFKYFRFPTLHLTKRDMEQLAEKYHFSHMMKMTWFCHKPVKNTIPCGRCSPCKMAKLCGIADEFAKPDFIRDHYLDTVLYLKKTAVSITRKFSLLCKTK